MTTRNLSHSDYWSVLETATGRKIVDCGDESDAWAMVAFDPAHRTVTKNRLLAGPVVDVVPQPLLPTSSVTAPAGSHRSGPVPEPTAVRLPQVSLPAGTGEPVVV